MKALIKSIGYVGRLIIAKIEEGEEVLDSIARLIESQGLKAGIIWGLGGLSYAEIGFFDYNKGEYNIVEIREEEPHVIELASMTGNFILHKEKPLIHIHAVLGINQQKTLAGHLVKAHAKPLVEAAILEITGSPEILEVFNYRIRRAEL